MVKSRAIGFLALLSPCLVLACVSSPVLAPSDGQIILSANPLTIVLDEFANPPVNVGTALIRAQILDAGGIPQSDVAVTFNTNGGSLASAPAGQTPTALETDDDGFVSDTLTVGLGDPDTITVTVRSGTLSGTIEISKEETAANRPPFAFINITPQSSALINGTVIYDGSASDDPDGDPITCYQWQIEASAAIANPALPCVPPNSRCEISQGVTNTLLTRSYSSEQSLAITLRVTDDPALACAPAGPVEPAAAFGGVAADSYEIVCDRSAPTAGAGGNQVATLTGTPKKALVPLSGQTSFDAESGIASYDWNCGNGTGSVPGSSCPGNPGVLACTTCEYTVAGTYVAVLTVTNGCGLTAIDDVVVTVVDPGA